MDRNYNITLLRHAESIGNADDYYQGQTDFPLTEKGREQAKKICQRWLSLGKNFDFILSSPLARARQTTEIIANILKKPVEYDPIWMERDSGKLSGLRVDEAQAKYPKPEFIPIYEHIGITGESQWELFMRAGAAVQLIQNRPPADYLVVSHGAFLNMFLYSILSIAPQANFQGPLFYFTNTGYASLTYYPKSHNWILLNFENSEA